jgi:hypothetical protein
VVAAVARQKRDTPTGHRRHRDRIRRRAIGCVDDVLLRIVEQGIQAGAADDRHIRAHCRVEYRHGRRP